MYLGRYMVSLWFVPFPPRVPDGLQTGLHQTQQRRVWFLLFPGRWGSNPPWTELWGGQQHRHSVSACLWVFLHRTAVLSRLNSHMDGHVVGQAVLVGICDVVDGTYSHDDLSQGVNNGQVDDRPVQREEEEEGGGRSELNIRFRKIRYARVKNPRIKLNSWATGFNVLNMCSTTCVLFNKHNAILPAAFGTHLNLPSHESATMAPRMGVR